MASSRHHISQADIISNHSPIEIINPLSYSISLPSLPIEIVAEIFCRLPVKLLLQLKCLNKSINSLISDPKFTKKHLQMSITRHNVILKSKDKSHVISYPLQSIFNSIILNPTQHDIPFNEKHFNIIGSCDGILCLVVNLFSVILWNPSIQKFKRLPSLKNPFQRDRDVNVEYGFGYDTSIDIYKVVAIFINASVKKAKIKVHVLGTNSWRMIQGDIPVPVIGSLCFVSEKFNWLDDTDYNIISFDLVNESYNKFMLPNYGVENIASLVLDVLKSCLSIIVQRYDFFDVWQMKQYGNEGSWTKLCRVSFPSFVTHAKAIWIFDDDKLLLVCEELLKTDMVAFDINSGSFMIPKMQISDSLFYPKVCIESLISPDV
ncbi:F-box/kelch-repeat protein At3g23880-like [Vicia villosa]|uniref:F-box/kelch-repeat protein At3g23880-like n=1 Tax=Vicia villosa TaxID=3911 RepID=UPI00273C5E09|nr:F-box/kelch-repeat protein At3g23880-like [Vicia villosa]